LEGIETLNMLNKTNRRKIPDDATLDFIPNKWLSHVIDGKGNINKSLYELSLLKELKDGLKAGNIYVDNSRHYADLSSYLIPDKNWITLEKDVCKQVNLPLEGEKRINALIKDTVIRYQKVDKLLNKSDKIRMEKGEIVISPLEAEEKPQSLLGLEEIINKRLPQVDLSDLLIEVDNWINYSKGFEHADYTEHSPELKYLYAALLGLGSNLGLKRMSQISSLSYHRLSYLSNWYVREETLKKSIDKTVDYYYHIPLSRFWGDGTFSSSDGYDVKTSGKIRNAGYLSRKFGPGKGIFFYSWTGDLYLQYGSKVISANVRDATHVLDGILNNETELSIMEHTTDTKGYTYIVFALFDLLGLKFSPRIRDLKDQSLFRVDDETYKNLEHRMRDKINIKLILQHWDELKRIIGSLKLGWVSASLYISKLQSYPRKNIMTKVLQEYGKLVRTNFILRYLEDEEFRRRIQAQLNKGEAVNGLRDFLFFANEKTIRKKQLEEQMIQSSCLTLLSNIVMTWNTVYMSEIIQQLIDEGYPINEDDLSRLSPARYEHINPYGKFYFNVEQEMNRKGLRPLRNYKP
jgi:TnpA family transposase